MFVRNLDELHKAMELDTEIETIEFKQASSNYKLQDAARYCAAISNEGGGSLILGVTDKRPRQAIGTEACSNLDDVKKDLFDWLGFKIEVAAINAPKRVLSFIIPGRPIGRAVHFRGRYEIRAGSHLRPMAWEELERIRNEGEWDFSSNVIAEATNSIFDSKLVEKFRNGWMKKTGSKFTFGKNTILVCR
jgi:ATP-dependent DNA helicase RecG